MKKYLLTTLFSLLFALSACAADSPVPTPEPALEATNTPPAAAPTETPAPTDTPLPTSTPALPAGNTPLAISEVMAGDMDFVELYNASTSPINLKGYRVVYRLGTTEEDLLLFAFDQDFLLPPYHHVLLAKDDNDLRMSVDGSFSQQMNVKTGDLLQVKGVVKERSGQTELALSDLSILSKGGSLPEAISLDPPEDPLEAALYYEALEGMLVQADGAAVSPISKYGETSLVLSGHNLDRLLKNGPAGLLIVVDDNSWTAQYDDASDLPFSIVTGDTVEGVSGPLAYTFGQYKIEPIAPPIVTPGDFERSPSLPEIGADAFSLASYNVENFFDNKEPNPADPPRPSRKEYQRKASKIANSIKAMGYPTIIGFSEVENVEALEKVAEQPQLADYGYQAVLVEGRDSRGIDVCYLARGDQVEVVNCDLRLDDEGLFTRGPLLFESRISTNEGEVTLYTLVNHFVSLGAGFEATEPRRVKQAQWNLDIVAEIRAAEPDAYIAILGDLNTFFDTPSINLMREAGFVHVFDQLSPEERYTYIYQGESEALDHILVTPGLAELIAGVDILHINADFPPPDPNDESYRRTSDHDPVVVKFKVK